MSSRGDFVVFSMRTIGSVLDAGSISGGMMRWYLAWSLESNGAGLGIVASGNRKDGMSARTRKIVAWTIGMALVGSLFGAMGSHSEFWYQALIDDPASIVLGASIGLLFGSIFSRNLPASR